MESTFEVTYRHAANTREEAVALAALDLAAWGEDAAAPEDWIAQRLARYAYGTIVAKQDGRVIGSAVTLRIKGFNPDDPEMSWLKCTGDGVLDTHDPEGETIFGVNFSVHQDAPEGVGSEMLRMILRDLIVAGNCVRGAVGCRLPGFAKAKEKNAALTAEEYFFGKRENGKPLDPHVRLFSEVVVDAVPFLPIRPIPNYFADPDSLDHGGLMMWMNPHYRG